MENWRLYTPITASMKWTHKKEVHQTKNISKIVNMISKLRIGPTLELRRYIEV